MPAPYFGSRKAAVADAVAALIGVELCLGRLPAGIPDGIAVLYVEIFAVGIVGNVIVAVARQP